MKKLSLIFFLFCFTIAKAQNLMPRVIDSLNNKPLAYAIVIYNHNLKVIYTDLNGFFTLQKDSLKTDDTLYIQFLGYKNIMLKATNIYNGLVIKMQPDVQSLQPVVVTNCARTEEYMLNKRTGRIKQYVGPGPETRLVIMARYYNVTGRNGYIKKVSVLFDEKSPNLRIPVRLRWYEWNNDTQMPGKELTDTSIIVYPYRQGWNEFEVPANTIECPKDWIVFGFEFIYPPEYATQYQQIRTTGEKLKWLNDIDHRWSLSMQYVDNVDEGGFYILNNADLAQYSKKYDRYFMRPAVRFTVVYCR